MTSVTHTTGLHARRETAEHVAKLLHEHRERLGTRRGTRALGAFKQAALVLRRFIDGARLVQLARDNGISTPTAYRYLHEGLTVLADHAPDLSTARVQRFLHEGVLGEAATADEAVALAVAHLSPSLGPAVAGTGESSACFPHRESAV